MIKVLLAIKTCHKADYFIDADTRDWLNDRDMRELDVAARRAAQRETFLKHLPENFDYKFFFGDQLRDPSDPSRRKPSNYVDTTRAVPPPQQDEVYLSGVLDTYTNVSKKTSEIVSYAVGLYDLILIIDDDTFIYPDRVARIIDAYDLDKKTYAGAPTKDFHTGNMLFLNKTGMAFILGQRITHYADDLWIGRIMKSFGVPTFDIPDFKSDFGTQYVVDAKALPEDHEYAALHSCKPSTMRELYANSEMQEEVSIGNNLQGGEGHGVVEPEPVAEAPGELQPASSGIDRAAAEVDLVRIAEDGASNTVDSEADNNSLDNSSGLSVEGQPS